MPVKAYIEIFLGKALVDRSGDSSSVIVLGILGEVGRRSLDNLVQGDSLFCGSACFFPPEVLDGIEGEAVI